MRRVICLSGWRGAGKDTVADYLVREFGFRKFSFAARLKDSVAETYGLERQSLDDRLLKEAPIYSYPVISTDNFTLSIHQSLQPELREGYWTPRALCILEGSIKRSVDPNYWTRSVLEQIVETEQDCVISDMRYKSEADTIRALLQDHDMQPLLWRIHRYDTITTLDPSERDLDNYSLFDDYIQNHGSMEDLYASVRYTMSSYPVR